FPCDAYKNAEERAHRAREDETTGFTTTQVSKAIRENCMDGKWHTPEAIAKRLEMPVRAVEKSLGSMSKRGTNNFKIERKEIRRGLGKNITINWQYRLFPSDKTVSLVELTEKLRPLIETLRREALKSEARFAQPAVAAVAYELEDLLAQWSQLP